MKTGLKCTIVFIHRSQRKNIFSLYSFIYPPNVPSKKKKNVSYKVQKSIFYFAGCPLQHDQEDFALLSRCSCLDVINGVYSGLGLHNTISSSLAENYAFWTSWGYPFWTLVNTNFLTKVTIFWGGQCDTVTIADSQKCSLFSFVLSLGSFMYWRIFANVMYTFIVYLF